MIITEKNLYQNKIDSYFFETLLDDVFNLIFNKLEEKEIDDQHLNSFALNVVADAFVILCCYAGFTEEDVKFITEDIFSHYCRTKEKLNTIH